MTLYFAYGSNMSRADMRVRCPSAKALGAAVLDGWQYFVMRDGYASVRRQNRSQVHGVLWHVTAPDIAALDAYEDLKSGLYRRAIVAVRHRGALHRAMIYIGRDRTDGVGQPDYVDGIVDAARDWKFPPRYLRDLARWSHP